MTSKTVNRTISRFIIEKYSAVLATTDDQLVEMIDGLASRAKAPVFQIQILLNDAARAIHRLLGFKEVAIGLKDKDGKFRYAMMLGFRDEAEIARKKIAYSEQDMLDMKVFPGIKVGRLARVHLSEDKAYKQGEESSYNRPSMLGQTRTSVEDMIEGDYIEVDIFGANNKLVGWIEASAPRDGKFPPRETVIWLEFIATTLGCLIRSR